MVLEFWNIWHSNLSFLQAFWSKLLLSGSFGHLYRRVRDSGSVSRRLPHNPGELTYMTYMRSCYCCYWSLFVFFAACASPEVISGTSGLFSSFNFPTETPKDSTCFWNITVPEGFVVKITFHAFSLSPADTKTDCSNAQGARLRISDVASTEQARYPFELCGQTIPNPVYTSTNTIQVRLKTPAQHGVIGFNASYESISPDMCKSSCISSFIFLRRSETPVYIYAAWNFCRSLMV